MRILIRIMRKKTGKNPMITAANRAVNIHAQMKIDCEVNTMKMMSISPKNTEKIRKTRRIKELRSIKSVIRMSTKSIILMSTRNRMIQNR